MRDKLRQLARLAEIQRLRKFSHETRLAALQRQIADIDAEEKALAEMQDRHYEGGASFVPLNAIVARLDTLSRRKDHLVTAAEREQRALLETSRMLDRVDEKHLAEKRSVERAEGAKALEEALPHLIARSRSSLP